MIVDKMVNKLNKRDYIAWHLYRNKCLEADEEIQELEILAETLNVKEEVIKKQYMQARGKKQAAHLAIVKLTNEKHKNIFKNFLEDRNLENEE